ncbi:hypothetical protein Ancab_033076 [Ancistrocladus abbreviatus]
MLRQCSSVPQNLMSFRRQSEGDSGNLLLGSSENCVKRSLTLMTGSIECTSMEGSSDLLELPDSSDKKACYLRRTCLGGSLRSGELMVNFKKSSPVRTVKLKESSEELAFALSEVFTPVPLSIHDPASVLERQSLRRSPRLCSPVPLSIRDPDTVRERKSQRRSPRLWCPVPLSIHDPDTVREKESLQRCPRLCSPVPLSIQDPDTVRERKSQRRSPRLWCPVPLSIHDPDTVRESESLRRSPRLCSPVQLRIQDPDTVRERESLRRSPRLCSPDVSSQKKSGPWFMLCSSAAAGVLEREPEDFKDFHKSDSKVLLLGCSEKHLRRSPRLMKSERSSDQLKLSDSARMKACETVSAGLAECELGILSRKRLRSREVTIYYPGKGQSDSGGNADISEQKIMVSRKKKRSSFEEEEAGLNLVNEKCMRKSPRFVSGYDDGKSNSGTSPCKNIETSLQDSNMQILLEKRVRKSPRLHSSSVGDESVKMEDNRQVMSSSVEEKSSAKSEPNLAGSAAKMLEEKLLRRSPRELTSSSMIDDVEMKLLPKLKEQPAKEKIEVCSSNEMKQGNGDSMCFFIGDPIPDEEARERWHWRYEMKNRGVKGRSLMGNVDEEDELVLNVKCHYTRAQINGSTFDLGDCAYVRGEESQKHIGRIIEFFQTTDEEDYCRIQWFYRASDTVMKDEASFLDKKRVFYSTIMNDNLLNCIISKVNVIQVTPQLNLKANPVPPSDYYYDMEYVLEYSTFHNLQSDNSAKGLDLSSLRCVDTILPISSTSLLEDMPVSESFNKELALLDLYSGCGAMSTGLCLGAKLSGVTLLTRWAVDSDSYACKSLRLNHPETQVRNETAEDFLELLKQWEHLCTKYGVKDGERAFQAKMEVSSAITKDENSRDDEVSTDEYEVSSLVDICFGDPDESGKRGLKFKVRWEGYGPNEDTWEPIEGLSDCQELIQEFVTNGLKTKILPLPGDVDVICGGPPCQGISGYNRFRSVDAPLDDDRNRQIVVFMNIVEFLKPKYVLMENVMDILRFDKASLGRYALSRLVHMHYQARVGIMAAGCYGLPQFRLRVFFWGALPSEDLPQFPLPTHDVVVRYWPPPEFERNVVAYDEGQPHDLQDAILLHDAISDLPAVKNDESFDEMPYGKPPETEFQKFIRSPKLEMMGYVSGILKAEEAVLYDHRPHKLFEDDYLRVCKIPRRKGANFRDLPGVIVGDDNVVRRDTTKDHELLPSGKPMVPDYALTFEQGKSRRPFARLWWDETLPTIVTFPNCHSLKILHPEQDRVLTVRECARLQGFPDYYRFCGTVKKRYRQIGNAVAIPVGRALGYALGMASQKVIGKEPLMKLPLNFSYSNSL